MIKVMVLVGVVLVATAGAVTAGTPPAIQRFLDKCNYYAFDAKTNEWTIDVYNAVSTSDPPDEDSCQSILERANKDGVADTFTVNVPWDSPDWKRGPHTVAELKKYCERAQRDARIQGLITMFELGPKAVDMAVKCLEYYDADVPKWKISPTQQVPYMGWGDRLVDGRGRVLTDPATGEVFRGTLAEGRKKFCEPYAKEYLAEKAKEEAPYRKVLKGDKLEVALAHLDINFDGPGKKQLKTPAAMAKAKHWYRLKYYDDRKCNNGAKVIYALERYYFDAKNKLILEDQQETCGPPSKSAYK